MMTETKIGPLIRKLSLPSLAAMLITGLYNTADTYFVSQLSTSASAAVGVVLPFVSLIQAASFTFAMGGGSLIGRYLGERRDDKANTVLNAAVGAVLALTVLITAGGLLFLYPLLGLFGATATSIGYAADYTRILLFGAPFMGTSFVLNHALRFQGKNFLSMIGIMTGGILNIILDPLFIFTFGLGIAGAAWATILSQAVSFFILVWMIQKKSLLSLSPAKLLAPPRVYFEITRIGAASFFRQGMASIALTEQNHIAGDFGDAALAAVTIVGRIAMLLFSTVLGIGQGYMPVAGYNYGAERYDRVLEAWRTAVRYMLILVGAVCLTAFLFAPEVIRLFRADDAEVIRIGTLSLRLISVSTLGLPFLVSTNMLMQATGQARSALFLAVTRQGLFFLPLMLILTPALGLFGLQLSQPLADVLAALSSLPIYLSFARRVKAGADRP